MGSVWKTWFLLSLMVFIEAGSEPTSMSSCLEKDQATELLVRCQDSTRINVLEVLHGHGEEPEGDEATSSAAECQHDEENECIAHDANIGDIRRNCQTKDQCIMTTQSVYLNACGKQSNYVRIKYECIPGQTATSGKSLDICGDGQQEGSLSQPLGYLQSLNYPGAYPDATTCTCHLSTSADAEIVLHMLDIKLQSVPIGRDWLEFAQKTDDWGRGRSLSRSDVSQDVYTGGNKVMVNFFSDSSTSDRGFWLRYSAVGKTSGREEAPVTVRCGPATPSYYRDDIVCFNQKEQRDEIFLSCQSLGIINVLRAHHGYYEQESRDQCIPIESNRCFVDSINRYNLLEKCMGQKECVVSIDEQTVPLCSVDSNYFQVQYHCVQDVEDRYNVIDICGDSTGERHLERTSGYIESLDYPTTYPINSECQCKIEAESEEAEVILSVLDMQMGASNECKDDWVEYVRDRQAWNEGTRLCTDYRVGDSVRTGAHKIYLNFRSGGEQEGRGFWLKYYGRNSDGSQADLRVHCSDLRRLQVEVPGDDATTRAGGSRPPFSVENMEDQEDEEDKKEEAQPAGLSLSLVVGLSAILVLMFVIILGMIIYKFKFRKEAKSRRRSSRGTETGVHHNSQNDAGYSTFRPPPANNYQTMPDDRSLSSMKSGAGTSQTLSEPDPDYRDDVHFARTPGRGHINPAYDGTIHTAEIELNRRM